MTPQFALSARVATRFSFTVQTLGEFFTAMLARRANMASVAASVLQCESELQFVANVSPANVGNVSVFAPCG
jgi:hypothetical protein